MILPTLPLELMHLVVEQLYGDIPGLLACSLTSKLLLNVARRQLFHRTVLTIGREQGRLPNFLLFIETTPTLAQYIRELRIQAAYKIPEETEFTLVQLGFILAKCASLQALELEGVSLRLRRNLDVPGVDADTVATSGWSLESLKMTILASFVDEESELSPYLYILSSFKKLDALDLHPTFAWDNEAQGVLSAALQNDLALDTLTLNFPLHAQRQIATLCRAIILTDTKKSLRTLKIKLQPGASLTHVWDVLVPACSALKDIRLDIRQFVNRYQNSNPSLPPEVRNVPITSLRLHCFAGLFPTPVCVCAVPLLLEQLPRTLQAIDIDLIVALENHRFARKHFLQMDWHAMAASFHTFKELQRVHFRIIADQRPSPSPDFFVIVKDAVVHGLTPLIDKNVSFDVE